MDIFPATASLGPGMHAVQDALITLQKALMQALKRHGVAFEDQSKFQAHVTLARDAMVPADLAVEAIGWRINQLALVQSTTRQDGTFYRVVAARESDKHT